MPCPCGSKQTFETCCAPYIEAQRLPLTAEALMRSRYAAYSKADIAYLSRTHAPETHADFNPVTTRQWAETSKFTNLNILRVEKGGTGDRDGTVEFVATFTQGSQSFEHHEVSRFRKDDSGQWLFVEGQSHRHGAGHDHAAGLGHGEHQDPDAHHQIAGPQTVTRDPPKPGRNDPCPCGSGKKFKMCCRA